MTLITRLPLTLGTGQFPKLSEFGVLPEDDLAALYTFEGADLTAALVDRSGNDADATLDASADDWTFADGIATAGTGASQIFTEFRPSSGAYSYAILAKTLDNSTRYLIRGQNFNRGINLQTVPSANRAQALYFDGDGTNRTHTFNNVPAGEWVLHLMSMDIAEGVFSYSANALALNQIALVTGTTQNIPDGGFSSRVQIGSTGTTADARHDVAFFAGWNRTLDQDKADALYAAVRRWAGDVKGIALPAP